MGASSRGCPAPGALLRSGRLRIECAAVVLSEEEARRRLAGIELFEGLDAGDRDAIVALFHVESLEVRHVVLHEGQANDRLYAVLGGCLGVKLPRSAARNAEQMLAHLGEGAVFGEYSLYDGKPVSATVFVEDPACVAWIEKRELDAFSDSRPQAGRCLSDNMIKALIRRLRDHMAVREILVID